MAIEQNTTAKEKILKKVRQALISKSKVLYSNIDLDSNVYSLPLTHEPILETFAKNFTLINGQFIYCDNHFDFLDKFITLTERKKYKSLYCWEESIQEKFKESGIQFIPNKKNLITAQVGVTSCEAIVARTGSILLSSTRNGRSLSFVPHTHIVVAYTSQVVMEIKDAMQIVKNRYGRNMPSMLSIISGPSCSTSIENIKINGGQGPNELFLFLIDNKTEI